MSLRLLWRGNVRFLLGHRWQTSLTILGIALGVAVVVAVDLANESARRAMDLSLESVSGTATHRIEGGPDGLDEHLYVTLRLEHGVRSSAPVVTDNVRVNGRTYTLLGIDPLAELTFGRYGGAELDGGVAALDADGVVLARSEAERLGLSVGDRLIIEYSGRSHQARLSGVVDDAATTGLILADIALAQGLLERLGVIDYVDLSLASGQVGPLQSVLPEQVELISLSDRQDGLQQMTRGFHHNLTAMSLLALLIGGLLVYNTMTFSLLRRRHVLGIQRALGVTGRELLRLIFWEALSLALLGTAIGLALGIVLAQGIASLVLRTVNDLYFVLTVSEFAVAPVSLLRGAALGIGVTLVAVAIPALEVVRTPPVAALRRSGIERHAGHLAEWLAVVGVLLMLAGAALAAYETPSLVLGFVALGMLAIGFCLAVPWVIREVIRTVMRLLSRVLPGRLGLTARLTLRGIEAGLSRTGLATASLSVAVAATVSVVVMVTSFRDSVDLWLQQTLAGDVYLTLPGRIPERPGPGLPASLIRDIERQPGVAGVIRSRVIRANTDLGRHRLLAVHTDAGSIDDIGIGAGLRRALPLATERFIAGDGVMVSEPLAYHHDLAPGDEVILYTAGGAEALPVLGIFTDYTSSQGMIALQLDRYRSLSGDGEVSGLAINAAPETDLALLVEAVRDVVASQPVAVTVQASADIRRLSLEIFDRTFAVTHVLRLLTVVVAFAGIFTALMLLQLERLRDMAILRATGMTGGGVARLVLAQSGVMGLLAGLLALPLGLVLSAVLVHVINVRAFGWSMGWVLPWPVLGEALALAVFAALLAGVYPAWRAARTEPARALREE